MENFYLLMVQPLPLVYLSTLTPTQVFGDQQLTKFTLPQQDLLQVVLLLPQQAMWVLDTQSLKANSLSKGILGYMVQMLLVPGRDITVALALPLELLLFMMVLQQEE